MSQCKVSSKKLVSQLAGEFSAPVFVPHLTLLPEQWGQEAEILALVTSLAREVSTPITLQILTVVARNSYFQCVLATTSLPEELAQLATGARQLFGVADENIPFHHTSVCCMTEKIQQNHTETRTETRGRRDRCRSPKSSSIFPGKWHRNTPLLQLSVNGSRLHKFHLENRYGNTYAAHGSTAEISSWGKSPWPMATVTGLWNDWSNEPIDSLVRTQR